MFRFTPATMPPRKEEGARKRFLNQLREQVLIPTLSRRPVGTLVYVDTELVIPDHHYALRQDLLRIFERGLVASLYGAWDSIYFRHQRKRTRSTLWAIVKLIRYYRLFRSMSMNGFVGDPNRPEKYPWLFCAAGDHYRYDGMHRASIARHLGMKYMPVLLITPSALLALEDIPNNLRARLSELDDPHELDVEPVVTVT